jgi:hypothetical protein
MILFLYWAYAEGTYACAEHILKVLKHMQIAEYKSNSAYHLEKWKY